ncbi:MAG: hypothetical protein JSW47_20470 [Phycisphaerales bacterium]|nr:MAG: hypothetical protein JSW47_20470 [Phycisphaerales bacterium]
MKEIYKNPVLYYIAIPVLVGLWPLLVWAVYLPSVQEDIEEQITEYGKAEQIMIEILTLDPERLEFAEPNETATEFSYTGVVNKVASLCDIPAGSYKAHSGNIVPTRNQRSQTANVDLKQVDIAKFARFLSLIQLRWANLQCESVKLTRKDNMPSKDVWDVDLKFKYFY